MTRNACEDALLALAARAAAIYRAYAPEGGGLSVSWFDGQIDVTGFGSDVAATRFRDGAVRRWKGDGADE